MDHDGLVFLRHSIEGFLHDMAAKSIHAQAQGVAANRVGNSNDLVRRPVLEAALHKEVTETVDHERISLSHNSLDDLEFLFGRSHFELLLEEDRSLLIVVAHNLVNNVLPVAGDTSIE